MTHTIHGVFSFIKDQNGRNDGFTIVDDDGMPFVLEWLKAFEGKEVKITIEARENDQTNRFE
jgi:hypothetical protein